MELTMQQFMVMVLMRELPLEPLQGIVISSNQIQAFGTVASTTSGVHTAGSGYTFGTELI